ncbi:hypothetical protein TNIN_157931 [Trichonephila inaurata madagascariensis]|uniref:Uncharacterized protein n=1 Tax=Trichonephila inaurata madagascariensis TaxID=2747483 RepID=A0A8X6K8S3_9ARAC|nr:hypothetical protein TNIN_157931 [Trichonephila inaurata madagascariensis]
MEIELPDTSTSCDERCRILREIEGLDIIISRCTELENLPDTDDNQEMKAILRASIDDALKKKDALVRELRSLPTCTTFNCQVNYCTAPPLPIEEHKDSDSNHDSNNFSEAPSNLTNAKNKKRKIKKDSAEDFVFPKACLSFNQ